MSDPLVFDRYSTGGSVPDVLEGLADSEILANGGNPNDTGKPQEKSPRPIFD